MCLNVSVSCLIPEPNQMILFMEEMFTNKDTVELPSRIRNVRRPVLHGDRNRRGRTWSHLHQEDSQRRNNPPGETTPLGRIQDKGEYVHMV